MTDAEIIQGLINRDNKTTQQFFFVKCRPLFHTIIRLVFSFPVDYDEFVNELYKELMKDDACKLRQFDYRSSIYQWLKTVAIRHFIHKRDELIENASREPLSTQTEEATEEMETFLTARMDLNRFFDLMPNKRYVYVLQKLVLEERDSEEVAQVMGITTANLYNIKKRAMALLSHIALKELKYGKI